MRILSKLLEKRFCIKSLTLRKGNWRTDRISWLKISASGSSLSPGERKQTCWRHGCDTRKFMPRLGDRFEAEVRAALLRTAELPESAPVLRWRIPGDCWCENLITEFSTAFTALAL